LDERGNAGCRGRIDGKFRDVIDAIRYHLSDMDRVNLQGLEAKLPKNAKAGSAEMVMLLLVYREIENRKQ
jgi:hypothetical protein